MKYFTVNLLNLQCLSIDLSITAKMLTVPGTQAQSFSFKYALCFASNPVPLSSPPEELIPTLPSYSRIPSLSVPWKRSSPLLALCPFIPVITLEIR